MAGTDTRFDAARFREAITFAMNMGLPQELSERATFEFRKERTWPAGTRVDQDGNALDPNVSPIITQPADVQIPCAVEFDRARVEELPVGAVRPTRATITILDDQWNAVKDAIYVKLGGDRYLIAYQHPPIGLFEVTVRQLACFAVEES